MDIRIYKGFAFFFSSQLIFFYLLLRLPWLLCDKRCRNCFALALIMTLFLANAL